MPSKIPPELGFLFGLGWSLAIWMSGGVLLGRWLDGRFGWTPWGLISGTLMGMAGGAYTFYRAVQKLNKKNQGP